VRSRSRWPCAARDRRWSCSTVIPRPTPAGTRSRPPGRRVHRRRARPGGARWLDQLLDSFCGTPGAVTDEAREAYRRSFLDPATIHATCEDYRAGATVEPANDAADRERGRRIPAPVLALWQQPPGMELPFDPLAVWRRWADEVDGHGLDCGHLLAEERPDEVIAALRPFLA
jgi:pimeloyl-ACP methyl ester carboxylesterase